MGINLRSVGQVGLVGALASWHVCLVGMLETFAARQLVGGALTLGYVLLLAILLVSGYVAAQRAKHLAGRLVSGLLAGLIVGLALALLAVITASFDLRSMFVFASPRLVQLLTFERGLGALYAPILSSALVGLLGAALALVPPLWRRIITLSLALWRRYVLLVLAALALLTFPRWGGLFLSNVAAFVGLFIIMGLGLNLVVGFAGLLDLGYVGFYAIGAYTVAILTSPEMGIGLDFWVALPIAMLAAMISGAILALPVLRMRGDYLAITTLGFGEIIRILLVSDALRGYLGGAQGITRIDQPQIGELVIRGPQQF